MNNRSRQSAGDTIVEVLIAIAVATAVIGGAYKVVNRTLANAGQAQEHSEALKIAEGQLEHLKVLTETDKTIFTDYANGYRVHCITDDGALVKFPLLSTLSTQQTSPTPDKYPDQCKNLGESRYYRVGIEYKPGNTGGSLQDKLDDVFVVAVDWAGATGGNDHVSLEYKVMQQ